MCQQLSQATSAVVCVRPIKSNKKQHTLHTSLPPSNMFVFKTVKCLLNEDSDNGPKDEESVLFEKFKQIILQRKGRDLLDKKHFTGNRKQEQETREFS